MRSTRREFLQATGALAICFTIPACSREAAVAPTGTAIAGNRLTILAGGEVELLLGKVEFGQGIGTAMAQIAAEELDIDIARIRLSTVDTDVSPNEFYTFSSISVQQSGPPTRRAAAAARQHLLGKAAAELGTASDGLHIVDGEVFDASGSTGLDYWQLIGDESIELDVSDDQSTKPVDQYSIVGTSHPRIDIPGKVLGGESFLQDMRLPGMVHARIVRPPFERGTLAEFDAATAEAMPGVVRVIRDGNFVAVVAEREEQARRAAVALRDSLRWNNPEDMPDHEDIYDWLKSAESRVEAVASKEATQPRGEESVKRAYQRPYQAHASMAPSAAVAQFDGDSLTVWSHAQGMYPLRTGIAHVMGLDEGKVRCIHREASGGYGHNGADDAAYDAAAIAMHVPGAPVRLQWERRDEMAWEPYGSAMHIEVEADLDSDGNVKGWDYDLWSCPHSSRPRDPETSAYMAAVLQREDALPLPAPRSIPQPNGGADRNAVPLYAFDRIDVNKHFVTEMPLRVSALRGLGAYANVFAIESFLDELAERAGADPIEYRLRHLEDRRAIELLERLAEVSDWANRPAAGSGEGWGVGFARFKNLGSWVGIVARVNIADNDIRVTNAHAVCDAGLVINPDGVRAQIEGGIVQSTSWTLMERVEFDASGKRSLDWASYPILRFDEVPDVEVDLMSRPEESPVGVGEAAQGPMAAAIANAVYHATGQRIRRLPISLA